MIRALRLLGNRSAEWCASRQAGVLVSLHLALASLGVIGAFLGLRNVLIASYGVNFAQQALDARKYFDWLRPYHFPEHKYTLIAYALALVALGLFLLGILLGGIKKDIGDKLPRKLFPGIYVADVLIVLQMLAMGLGKTHGWVFVLSSIGVWLGVTGLPFVVALSHGPGQARLFRLLGPGTLTLIFSIEFIIFMLPFVTGRALFYNDHFAEIPTYTWVRAAENDAQRLVDTIRYANDNRMWGHLRRDPRQSSGEDPACPPEFRIGVPASPELRAFADAHRGVFYFHHSSGELCFVGRLTDDQIETLRWLTKDSSALAAAYAANTTAFLRWEREAPSFEHEDFIKRNRFELERSLEQLEAIFHHHFQYLNPIKEFSLGRPLQDVVSLYGLGFLPVYALMKLAGGVNYQSFLITAFSSYLAYFALLAGMLAVIFRDSRYVAIVLLSSLALVKALGYVTVFTGLGYSPLRHFHDVFLILFVYLYFARGRSLWLWCALAAALAGVLLDRMYGSFGLLALMAMLAIRALAGQGRAPEKGAIVSGLAAYALLFWGAGALIAPNPYVGGFLDGVWGFPVGDKRLIALLAGIIAAHLAFAYLIRRVSDQRLFLSLFLLLYSEALAFYWLVIPNYGHLYALLPMVVLTGATLAKFGLSHCVSPLTERRVSMAMLGAAALLSILGSARFVATAVPVWKTEADHQVFVWPFENAAIRSTMDPMLFAEAKETMRRWEPQKGVYVISQFDTLLTWLAGKYSLMPHADLVSYLSGPPALEATVDLLRKQRPEILFVDSCIECSLATLQTSRESLLGINPALSRRIREKVDRLKQLQDVFAAVKQDYERVDGSGLVSVYRRKPGG